MGLALLLKKNIFDSNFPLNLYFLGSSILTNVETKKIQKLLGNAGAMSVALLSIHH